MDDQSPSATRAIEIRIEDISQLFHSLDPFPFRERDLDDDAEEFIVSWARELPTDQPLKIIVHLPDTQASRPEAKELGAAITRYFNYRADIVTLDLKELFRVGRRALAIGATVLSFSVLAGRAVANIAPGPVAQVVEESLLIFGWVANWRPIEIFLYEWWPIVRRRNLYRRLAAAEVDLTPFKGKAGTRLRSAPRSASCLFAIRGIFGWPHLVGGEALGEFHESRAAIARNPRYRPCTDSG